MIGVVVLHGIPFQVVIEAVFEVAHHLAGPPSPILDWLILRRREDDAVVVDVSCRFAHQLIACRPAIKVILLVVEEMTIFDRFPRWIALTVLQVLQVAGKGGRSLPLAHPRYPDMLAFDNHGYRSWSRSRSCVCSGSIKRSSTSNGGTSGIASRSNNSSA